MFTLGRLGKHYGRLGWIGLDEEFVSVPVSGVTNGELRETLDFELREDGTFELRE